jgi:serine/threonine-protein kinase
MSEPNKIGRYLVFEAFARGGMGSVHFGRVLGPVGFSRVVAIKRHHPPVAKEPEFVAMLIDEARLAGRVRHPNVVPVIDVVSLPGELLLVMDYVEGLSLARLWLAAEEHGERVPVRIASSVLVGALQGLHAAHETRDERGESLGIVHRDVSPQNILVGADGLARVTDFGIAHAKERLSFTRTSEIKGKLEYMSKEQIRRGRVGPRSDVYAAGVVLWETLTGERLFAGDDVHTMLSRMDSGAFGVPSVYNPDVPKELDQLVLSALAVVPENRPASAREMAVAIEKVGPVASQLEVAEWVKRVAGRDLEHRAQRVSAIEAYVEDAPASTSTSANTMPSEDSAPTPEMGVEEPEPPRAGFVAEVRPTPTFTASYAGSPSPKEEITTPVSAPHHEAPPLSSATPEKPSPPAAHPSRVMLMIPLLALIGSVLVVLAVLIARGIMRPPEPSPVAPEADAPPPQTTEAPAVAPTLEPPSTSIATEVAEPQMDASAPRRVFRPRPKPNCNPPFRYDADGVKIPKAECFKK